MAKTAITVSSQPVAFADFLDRLRADYPTIAFCEGRVFCWSPAKAQVMYRPGVYGHAAMVSVLHELGHALLTHRTYRLDFELLQMEVAAWEKAKEIAAIYEITIDDDHAQDCLDSYRDWLFRRSICPSCSTKALQQDDGRHYRCHNCSATWRVSPSRFCRPYRMRQA